jgi:hypothetical protein
MGLTTLSGPHEPVHSWPKLKIFRWPLIWGVLTLLSAWGVKAGGIGPCGGPGLVFVPPFLICGCGTAISLCFSVYRLMSGHRATREPVVE